MKILVSSPAYLPLVGGLEINTAHLAESLLAAGHEVMVVTTTPAEGAEEGTVPVVRNPSPLTLLRWIRWCDLFFQANVSLRGLWPLLLIRRPWVASHHSWYTRTDGRIAWQDRLKLYLLRFAAGSISVSQAIADHLDTPSTVISNPYREHLFRLLPGIERISDLAFVGRLVSDKGVSVLLDALALLARDGITPHLTVVGSGPERPRIEEQARRLGLTSRIELLGTRRDQELVEILNRHRFLVVPSLYREPFGLVALEGIACGCIVIGSEGGGLKEAIGPCGKTFPNGDAKALARLLREVLSDSASLAPLLERAPEHLAQHTYSRVVDAYLRVFDQAVASRRASGRRRSA